MNRANQLQSNEYGDFYKDYLSTLKEGTTLQIYVQRNNAFKLPATDKDVIMIGPGTGVARGHP